MHIWNVFTNNLSDREDIGPHPVAPCNLGLLVRELIAYEKFPQLGVLAAFWESCPILLNVAPGELSAKPPLLVNTTSSSTYREVASRLDRASLVPKVI